MIQGEDCKTLFLVNYAYMDKEKKRECAWLVKKTFLAKYELHILDEGKLNESTDGSNFSPFQRPVFDLSESFGA